MTLRCPPRGQRLCRKAGCGHGRGVPTGGTWPRADGPAARVWLVSRSGLVGCRHTCVLERASGSLSSPGLGRQGAPWSQRWGALSGRRCCGSAFLLTWKAPSRGVVLVEGTLPSHEKGGLSRGRPGFQPPPSSAFPRVTVPSLPAESPARVLRPSGPLPSQTSKGSRTQAAGEERPSLAAKRCWRFRWVAALPELPGDGSDRPAA